MSKCDLIKRISKIINRPEADIREVFNLILREMERAFITGQVVDFRDFGCFMILKRAGRPNCRNPKKPTELFPMGPYVDVRFRVGKALKAKLQRLLPLEDDVPIGHVPNNQLWNGQGPRSAKPCQPQSAKT